MDLIQAMGQGTMLAEVFGLDRAWKCEVSHSKWCGSMDIRTSGVVSRGFGGSIVERGERGKMSSA